MIAAYNVQKASKKSLFRAAKECLEGAEAANDLGDQLALLWKAKLAINELEKRADTASWILEAGGAK